MSYFISETEVKKETTIPSTLNIELLRPWFKVAQNTYIKPILGIALYTELQTAVDNNTLTAEQIVLLVYVKDALAFYIQALALLFIQTQSSNSGLLNRNSNNGQSTDFDNMDRQTRKLMDIADNYANELKNYLECNKTLYPLYRSNYTTTNIKFSGIQFDKRYDTYCDFCGYNNCHCS